MSSLCQTDEYFANEFGGGIWPRNILLADGFDPFGYINTANLQFYPYTTQALIQAKLGGQIKLIEACDDAEPNEGSLNAGTQALQVYNAVLQNVTNEINGYLSTVYPVPFQQTGTVAIFRVTGITTDGLGTVTTIEPVVGANGNCGNYAVAPVAAQNPVYLKFLSPEANNCFWGGWYECNDWWNCQTGTGLQLAVAYSSTQIALGGAGVQNVFSVNGTPVIVSGGINYNCGDLLVLTGGASFVPAKVQEAMLVLCCHDFNQRRLSPDEKNIFKDQNKKWRGDSDESGLLQKIGDEDGVHSLDGTFKRFYSAVSSWNRVSSLQGPTT